MAKKSAIENNHRKMRLVKKFAARRQRLLNVANNDTLLDGRAFRGASEACRACRATAPGAASAIAAR